MSGGHWAGVVIPPDKGDDNHVAHFATAYVDYSRIDYVQQRGAGFGWDCLCGAGEAGHTSFAVAEAAAETHNAPTTSHMPA